MVDWSGALAAGLGVVLTPLVARAVVRRTAGEAEHDGGAFVLRYGGAWKALLAIVGLLVAGLVALLFAVRDGEGRLTVALLLAGGGALLAFGIVDAVKVAHRVDDAGFERRTPWSRHVRIAWSDVVCVRYEPHARVVLRARTGETARLSLYLRGLGVLAARVLTRVDPAALDDATRAALADLAARAAK